MPWIDPAGFRSGARQVRLGDDARQARPRSDVAQGQSFSVAPGEGCSPGRGGHHRAYFYLPADVSVMPTLDQFEERLGYKFLDQSYLRDALTHPSYGNERGKIARNDDGQFAFLGDAVLSLAVAADLMGQEGGKGTFTKERAEKVKNKYLAQMAKKLELPLRLGEGEKKNDPGEQKRLASGFEAVVGAIYLDAGPAHVINVVNKLLRAPQSPV